MVIPDYCLATDIRDESRYQDMLPAGRELQSSRALEILHRMEDYLSSQYTRDSEAFRAK